MYYEYCVMKNGNNIATDYYLEETIKVAKELNADYILKVLYDEKEREIGIERVWENE